MANRASGKKREHYSEKSRKERTSAAIPECSLIPRFTNGTPAKGPAGKIRPIRAANICFDNTACNLASLNLLKFKTVDGEFDVERFKAAVRIFITAQEIVVDNASYPIKEIAENSHIFRTLGLGYANLGSLVMSYGYSYDSVEGRALCGAVTAIMTGEAYEQSARMAQALGPFPGYKDALCNGVPKPVAQDHVAPMLEVIELNRSAVRATPALE